MMRRHMAHTAVLDAHLTQSGGSETDVSRTPAPGRIPAPVPFVDLAQQQAEVMNEITAGLETVFANCSFIGGPQVSEFEQAYAQFLGAKHCVGVGNGTDALELIVRASGIGPGDEVILPANSFVASAEAVSRAGAIPVFVDVDPTHLLIDPQAVAAAVTTRTRGIMPVHLYGQSAFVEQLAPIATACGAVLIEDAAQAQGARRFDHPAGTLGAAAGLISAAAGTSFYPGKNLGAAGDAGAVMTDDDELAERVRLLSAHGSVTKYVHEVVGMNSRLDTVQAVVLSAKLKRLASWNELRRRAALRYAELLAGTPGVVLPQSAPGNEDVWHLYVVRVNERERVLDALTKAGVGAGIHYPIPIHLTRAYEHLGYASGAFPVAEEAAGQLLSLPMFPHITASQQERVVGVLGGAL